MRRQYGAIFIGNVNASSLAQTNMAKSVSDAGWRAFRTMLQYKCDSAGVWFEEADERYSTQTCSCCEERTGPAGQTALSVREWACSVCQTSHQRDINAATNILCRGVVGIAEMFSIAADQAEMHKAPSSDDARAGRGPLEEGISVL